MCADRKASRDPAAMALLLDGAATTNEGVVEGHAYRLALCSIGGKDRQVGTRWKPLRWRLRTALTAALGFSFEPFVAALTRTSKIVGESDLLE